MVRFISLLQASQDGDGRFDTRFADQHFLETAFQRGIFLDCGEFEKYWRVCIDVVRGRV